MDSKETGELRTTLENERATLQEELSSHGRAVPLSGGITDWEGSTGGLSGVESDPTDAADSIEELITNVPLVEKLEQRYKEIVSALARMDKGTYDTCEVCGTQISAERLRANPAARTCMQHSL